MSLYNIHRFVWNMTFISVLSNRRIEKFILYFLIIHFMEVWLIYNVILISAVWQCDSIIHTHTHTLTHTYSVFILFHYGFTQDVKYSSLCYAVEPCCLSVLYIVIILSSLENYLWNNTFCNYTMSSTTSVRPQKIRERNGWLPGSVVGSLGKDFEKVSGVTSWTPLNTRLQNLF